MVGVNIDNAVYQPRVVQKCVGENGVDDEDTTGSSVTKCKFDIINIPNELFARGSF